MRSFARNTDNNTSHHLAAQVRLRQKNQNHGVIMMTSTCTCRRRLCCSLLFLTLIVLCSWEAKAFTPGATSISSAKPAPAVCISSSASRLVTVSPSYTSGSQGKSCAQSSCYLGRNNVLYSSSQAQQNAEASVEVEEGSNNLSSKSKERRTVPQLTHGDIIWKLGLSEDASKFDKVKQKVAAKLLRLSFMASKNKDVPRLLCPSSGSAFLEAKLRDSSNGKLKQVGRFGITTQRGPPCREMDESVVDLFGYNMPGAGTAAVIYMFVDPQYRHQGIGSLALEVIAAIHAAQGISFTVLVADDDGSNKLVEWYESSQPIERQFRRAPKLQNLMGSPGGKFGVTMMAPSSSSVENDKELLDRIQIKWW
jgi:GNAT superfamily N-acetyltransferase